MDETKSICNKLNDTLKNINIWCIRKNVLQGSKKEEHLLLPSGLTLSIIRDFLTPHLEEIWFEKREEEKKENEENEEEVKKREQDILCVAVALQRCIVIEKGEWISIEKLKQASKRALRLLPSLTTFISSKILYHIPPTIYDDDTQGILLDSSKVDEATMIPLDFQSHTIKNRKKEGKEKEEWVTIGRCGHWKDSRIEKTFSGAFGLNRWRQGYEWKGLLLDVRSGMEIYEEAYYRMFTREKKEREENKGRKRDNELLQWIIDTANDIYDTAETNVEAFCNYNYQEVEGSGQHWQDVTVRRCLLRLNKQFKGDHLVEIRGYTSEGFCLNPSELPFHECSAIIIPRQFGWWKRDSIEDFSMSNYIVQVRLNDIQTKLKEKFIHACESKEGIKLSKRILGNIINNNNKGNISRGISHFPQEPLEWILYAAYPPLLPIMAMYSLHGSYRTWAFVVRACILMDKYHGKSDTDIDTTSKYEDTKYESSTFINNLKGLIMKSLEQKKDIHEHMEQYDRIIFGIDEVYNGIQYFLIKQKEEDKFKDIVDMLLYSEAAIRRKAIDTVYNVIINKDEKEEEEKEEEEDEEEEEEEEEEEDEDEEEDEKEEKEEEDKEKILKAARCLFYIGKEDETRKIRARSLLLLKEMEEK